MKAIVNHVCSLHFLLPVMGGTYLGKKKKGNWVLSVLSSDVVLITIGFNGQLDTTLNYLGFSEAQVDL